MLDTSSVKLEPWEERRRSGVNGGDGDGDAGVEAGVVVA